MAARVKVHAAIWVEDKLVVHRDVRRGSQRTTLPGGRVGEHESLIGALVREVSEELGVAIEIGPLLCVAEILNSASIHDVELVFAASVQGPTDRLQLVDPLADEARDVLPPILGQLARQRAQADHDQGALWLGNVYRSGVHAP